MYIHKSINYRIREDLSNSDTESISVQVKVYNYKPFIVTSIYRSSGIPVDYFNELDKLFDFIDAEDKEIVQRICVKIALNVVKASKLVQMKLIT